MSTRSERLIYRRELTKRVGLSYPTIWKQMRNGKFPRGRAVGGKTAWLESEIDSWIAGLPERRLKGDPPERDTSDLQPDPDTADTTVSAPPTFRALAIPLESGGSKNSSCRGQRS